MSTTFTPNGFGPGFNPTGAIFDIVDQFRNSFAARPGASRVSRGDVRTAILTLLAEQPMHGYQIIHEIEERSGGSWKPSAGSVYPTLQLLADEGLIVAEEKSGRKTYSLTEGGQAEAGDAGAAPWENTGRGVPFTALPKAGMDLAAAAAQVGHTGTPEQVQEAVTILEEARRRLYSILAES